MWWWDSKKEPDSLLIIVVVETTCKGSLGIVKAGVPTGRYICICSFIKSCTIYLCISEFFIVE